MAIQKPEWFKMDPAKFLSDAQVDAMSTLELGACFRLLCRQWIDGFIPDDLHLLARLCRLDAAAMGEAWVTLEAFFPILGPGKRANRFMWVEREKVIADLERRSDQGTKWAHKRWDESRPHAAPNARPNLTPTAALTATPTATPTAAPNGAPIADPMLDQTRADQTRAEQTRGGDAPAIAEGFEPTPEDLPPLALARGLIERLNIPFNAGLQAQIADCIKAKARESGGSFAEAHDHIRDMALKATPKPAKWLFWFRDAQYDASAAGARSGANTYGDIERRAPGDLPVNWKPQNRSAAHGD
jgi:uncharacterized protein YdaU (DUF1376 family)